MKKIAYTNTEGGVSIIHPCEGARLATMVAVGEDVRRADYPIQAGRFFQQWPVEGAVVTWAETEEDFLKRVKVKSVPADAIDAIEIDAKDIPVSREDRKALRIDGGKLK